MNIETIERIFIAGAQFGTIQTLTELNLLNDKLMVNKAEKQYGKRFIQKWRSNGWIKFYPTGNIERGRFYVLRSECERAKHMHDFGTVPQNVIDRNIHPITAIKKQ